MKRKFALGFSLACGAMFVASLSGCATASTSQGMTTSAPVLSKKYSATVSLKVTGGKETSAARTSQISNEDFAQAIKSSFESAGLFSKVLGENMGDYALDVAIVRLQQPMFGASMTVTLETNWTLKRRSDNSTVWQLAIPSTYTAQWNDAFAGVTRIRLANEGAAKTNISSAMKAISDLKLE